MISFITYIITEKCTKQRVGLRKAAAAATAGALQVGT
jgi:hypothetical protein